MDIVKRVILYEENVPNEDFKLIGIQLLTKQSALIRSVGTT